MKIPVIWFCRREEAGGFNAATTLVCFAAGILAACAGRPTDQEFIGRATRPSTPAASATAVATARPSPTRPAPTSFTPEPTQSPTLGPLVTRTPAPPAICPPASGTGTAIELGSDPESLVQPLEPQIRDYLNAGGSAIGLQAELERLRISQAGFEPKTEAQVLVIDVTGDTTPDVLVELVFDYADLGGALFVFGCRDGAFETLYRRAIGGGPSRVLGPPDGIVAVRDMNADGVPEVVIAEVTSTSARGYAIREFQIMEWDGSRFAYLIPPYPDADDRSLSSASSFDGAGEIQDVDGDGLSELLLPEAIVPEYPDSGPQRERADIWAWNGYLFELVRRQYEPPTYRFQAAQDGDDATQFREFDRALTFYRQAVFDSELLSWSQGRLWPDYWYSLSALDGPAATPTPDPDEPLRLMAYARYRILLLHATQGYLPEGQIVYDTLQDMFPEGIPGHPYAELAAAFWTSFQAGQRMEEGCRSAVAYAAAHSEEILEPLGSDFYGSFNRDYAPDDICPFP